MDGCVSCWAELWVGGGVDGGAGWGVGAVVCVFGTSQGVGVWMACWLVELGPRAGLV